MAESTSALALGSRFATALNHLHPLGFLTPICHGNASPGAHVFCGGSAGCSVFLELVPPLRKKGSGNAHRPLSRLQTRARRPRCVPCLLDSTLTCTPLMLSAWMFFFFFLMPHVNNIWVIRMYAPCCRLRGASLRSEGCWCFEPYPPPPPL